jgi:aarF domain-containing kinase
VSLSPEFRRKYAELWYAIFIADLPTIKRICKSWGIGQAELFASATLLKPWQAASPSSITPASKTKYSKNRESEETMTREERQKMTEERQLQTMRELKEKLKTFLLDVELVPKELIFIGRAMRILQANNQAMGEYFAPYTAAVMLTVVGFM